MKKIILLAIISIFVAALFAATPRVYTQVLVTDQGELLPGVTNTSATHHPDYYMEVFVTTRPTEVISTTTHAAAQIKIYRFGAGTVAVPYATVANYTLAPFPTQWVPGEILRTNITHIPTGETSTWDCPIPTGTAAWGHRQPINPFPDGIVAPPYSSVEEYDLIVNSTPAGYAIWKDGVDTGQTTPHTFTPGEAGTYTLTARPGYAWSPASHVVAELTEDTEISFVSEWINVDPNVAVNPMPANGATIQRAWDAPVSGVVALSWEPNPMGLAPQGYKIEWNGGIAIDLGNVLTWNTPAIGVGAYTWKVIPYINAPSGKQAINTPVRVRANETRSAAVTRSSKNLAKGDAADCPLWGFSVAYDAPPLVYHDFEVTSEPVGAIIWVNGMETEFVAPHTFSMLEGTSALYSVTMEGYVSWAPADFQVTNIMQPGNVNFIGTAEETPDIPAGVQTEIAMGVDVTSDIDLNYGDPSPAQNAVIIALPNFANLNDSVVTVLTGSGIGTFTVEISAAGLWFGMAYYGGTWHQASPFSLVVPPAPGIFTFSNIDFDAKGDVIILLGEGADPTLPVELSSFSAVLTAQTFVALSWTSETETEMLGYRVYRAENSDVNSAVLITPNMIPATNTSTTQTYKHEDHEVAINTTYWYWLESVDYGTSHFHGPVSVTVTGNVTPELPVATVMSNVYPNPFRMGNNASIDVSVKAGENATVTIYNILGQAVKTFNASEGTHNLKWNGRDSKGNVCGSGIYFYKLSSPSMNQTKKMVIMK